ncbi:MAG: C25 family cysteine peptidase [Candidatus Alcyoniella australis]|nr:C25 family cysteine peptidase [Candidatus Alcyoniella australis]
MTRRPILRNRIWALALALVLIAAGAAFAQGEWISLNGNAVPGAEPELLTLESNNTEITLRISLPGFYLEQLMAEGLIYDRISVPGCATTEQIGMPELPVVRATLALPPQADVQGSIKSGEFRAISDLQVFPFQTPTTDEDPIVFDIDRGYYESGVPFPEIEFEVAEPATWRDLRVVQIVWSPFVYDPISGVLEIAESAEVRLTFSGPGTGTDAPIGPYNITPAFENSYAHTLVNFQSLNIASRQRDAADPTYDYLVIADPALAANAKLAELVAAHQAEGLAVLVVDTSTTGSTASEIKSYLTTFYSTNANTYVLFVGDVDAIPLYSWDGNPSDSWYTFLDGGDMYAEVGLGRFPAKNDADLNMMIDKTLDWIDNTYGGAWQQKSVLIAHKQEYPGKYTACKETIRTYSYVYDAPTFDTVYGGAGGSCQDATDAIEDGRVLVNYRGHGSATTWSSWDTSSASFTTTMAHALSTNGMNPVVYSIACVNMSLSGSAECLAEAFMVDTDGAVAFLGATQPSYTTPNHDFDRYLYRAPYDKAIAPISLILMDANAELYDQYGAGSYGETNIKMYLWLGDPAIEIPVAGLLSPESLTAAPDGEIAIDLSWTDRTSDEDGFEIERKPAGGAWSVLDTVTASVVSYSNEGLSEGSEYSYRVRAYKGSDYSLYSNSATTATLPAAPSDLFAQTLVGGEVYLVWTDNSGGESGYIVERATADKLDWSPLATLGSNSESYTDSGMGECETYSYQVRAYNIGGESANAGPAAATTLPNPASGLSAQALNSESIQLDWTDNSAGETGYRVLGKLAGETDYSEYAQVDADAIQYQVDSLDEATTYSFKVCAVGVGGDSPTTNDASATTLPNAPDGLSAHGVSESSVALAWSDNSGGESGYRIERLLAKDGEFEVVGVVAADASEFEDDSLTEATLATYRVRAFTDINDSAPSNEVQAASLPAAPSDLVGVVVSHSELEISWIDNSGGEAGYVIERADADDKGDFEEVGRVESNVVVFADEGLSAGTTYLYRVAAYVAQDFSAYSDEVELTTEGDPSGDDDDDDDDACGCGL